MPFSDGDVRLLGLLAVFLDRERALLRFRYASGGSFEGSSIRASRPVLSASLLNPLSVEFWMSLKVRLITDNLALITAAIMIRSSKSSATVKECNCVKKVSLIGMHRPPWTNHKGAMLRSRSEAKAECSAVKNNGLDSKGRIYRGAFGQGSGRYATVSPKADRLGHLWA